MRLTIIAIGSRGDIQPCVALGRGLSDEGYNVRIVTLENFEKLVRDQGLDFFPIEGDAQALTQEMMRGGEQNLLTMYLGMIKTFGAITESYRQSFSDPILRDSDAILSQLPAGLYSYDLAEHLQVPYIALSVIPQEITDEWVFSLFPSRFSLGRWYNRLTYRFGQQLVWQTFRRSVNKFRKQLGLPPASFWWGNMCRMECDRTPVIQGFSEHVISTPSEWGDHIHTTGYWALDEPDWQPPDELLTFLDAGDPPVFIGFGSMSVPNPEKTTSLILDAMTQSGKRCVLHSGWAKLGATTLPDTVFLLDYAPYTWLFPRMAVVIHHGGSGTTNLALRSGVPSMIVPFMADQPFWGERTHVLGVGPKPIPFSKLTTDNLAHAVRTMTSTTAMQQQAIELRDRMKDENGIKKAVEIIQKYII